MSRKIIIALIILLALVGGLWLIFGRGGGSPTATSTPPLGAPFGTPSSNVPAAQPGFEGEVAPLPDSSAAQASTTTNEMRLFKIESTPVAGFVILSHGSTTVVRYAERGTGHIMDAALPTIEKTRITNETLPQIYEAFFRSDGLAALFRSLDENDAVKNLSLSLAPPAASSTDGLYRLSTTLLRGQMSGLSIGTGDTLFYTLSDAGAVVSSKFSGDGMKTLWKGPFSSWQTEELGSGTLIFTKPSASLPGYAYRLAGGSLAKLLGPLNGLVARANPAGTYLIYSYSDGASTHLAAEAVQNGVSTELSPSTLADKCIGSAAEKAIFFCGASNADISGGEPDLWYQGKTHFSDDIWRFDLSTQNAEILLRPELDFGVPVDLSLPQLSPDERYLVFINKADLSLWAAELK